MKANPNLSGYKQSDIENLLISGSINPTIDEHGNLIIQNVKGQLYSSSISIELKNVVYIPAKVETNMNPAFESL